jgi:hypothetical protein
LAKFEKAQTGPAHDEGHLFKLFKKVPKHKIKGDPIKNIFKVNQKVATGAREMNVKLCKIIERTIELDRPILMHDKLDIIWDKEPSMKKRDVLPKVEPGIFELGAN